MASPLAQVPAVSGSGPAEWFPVAEAKERILQSQRALLEQLEELMHGS
jgi:predicted NUDIX family NTP pyrophosphohydrolase